MKSKALNKPQGARTVYNPWPDRLCGDLCSHAIHVNEWQLFTTPDARTSIPVLVTSYTVAGTRIYTVRDHDFIIPWVRCWRYDESDEPR